GGLLLFSAACWAQDANPAPAAAAATNTVGEINLAPMPLQKQIKALADMSNIKVMFDPKLLTGTNALSTNIVDSVNYEGVSARQVLDATLKNNNLVLVQDPD